MGIAAFGFDGRFDRGRRHRPIGDEQFGQRQILIVERTVNGEPFFRDFGADGCALRFVPKLAVDRQQLRLQMMFLREFFDFSENFRIVGIHGQQAVAGADGAPRRIEFSEQNIDRFQQSGFARFVVELFRRQTIQNRDDFFPAICLRRQLFEFFGQALRLVGLNGDRTEQCKGAIGGLEIFGAQTRSVEEQFVAQFGVVGFARPANPRHAQKLAFLRRTAQRRKVRFNRQIAQKQDALHHVDAFADVFGRDKSQCAFEQRAALFVRFGRCGGRFERRAHNSVFFFCANRLQRDERAFLARIPAQNAQICGDGLRVRRIVDARVGDAQAKRNPLVGIANRRKLLRPNPDHFFVARELFENFSQPLARIRVVGIAIQDDFPARCRMRRRRTVVGQILRLLFGQMQNRRLVGDADLLRQTLVERFEIALFGIDAAQFLAYFGVARIDCLNFFPAAFGFFEIRQFVKIKTPEF